MVKTRRRAGLNADRICLLMFIASEGSLPGFRLRCRCSLMLIGGVGELRSPRLVSEFVVFEDLTAYSGLKKY